jgi:hypothetical protein
VRRLFLVEKFAQDRDAFLETRDTLGVFDAHDLVLERLRGALLVRSAEADREPGTSAGNHVEAGPLLRQQRGMALWKGGHAADGEFYFFGDRGQRREQGDGFQAGFRQQTVADPDRIEGAGVFAPLRHVEKFRNRDGADNHAPIRQSKTEGSHRSPFGVSSFARPDIAQRREQCETRDQGDAPGRHGAHGLGIRGEFTAA